MVNINHRKKNIKRINNNKGKKLDSLTNSKTNNDLLYNNKNKKNSNKGIFKKNDIKNKKMTNIETLVDIKYDMTKKDIIKLSNTDEDLQDMDFEEAIIQDKRSYLRMYWSFLIDSQIILGTFCTENYLNLLVIKLSFLVFTFEISFFLNALFYTDDYISDAYHNNGILDFVSGLPKSIYSFIATLITTNLLRMLSNSKSELMKLIREYSRDKKYLYFINLKLRILKIKLIIYFILVFLLGICFLYYVSSFCAVYRYSQKYWFYWCLESFAMDSLTAIIFCIFLALFRFVSIKKHVKYLYVLANIISTFL